VCVLGVALLVCGCGDEVRVARNAVDERVAKGDAPQYVHARIVADGRITMRSTSGGASPTWTAWTAPPGVDFTPDDAKEAAEVALLPRVVVVIEADPNALWRYVQWVVDSAASPRESGFRVCFLMPSPARWLDIDLPTGETSPPDRSLRKVTVLTANLFRNNLDRTPDRHYTRIRLDRAQREVTEHLEEQVPDRDRPEAALLHSEPIDLPLRDALPDAHAGAWHQVEEQMASLVKDRSPWIGEIRTPFPKGLAVPCGDVFAVLEVFQRRGCGRIWLEGAPPPQLREDGGGWVLR
jgi:hypothetical protein